MPKKTTILILLLAAVTAVLVFLAVSAETGVQRPQTGSTTNEEEREVEKTATVFFNPQNIDVAASVNPVQSVDVMVNTGAADISGVQVELEFDPQALTNVRLEPEASGEGFFGSSAIILFNDVNIETGRISYAITIGPSQEAKQGTGKIATLYFEPALNPPSTTTVQFLNKTLVTVLGENESVLKGTTPLNITLSNPNAPTQTQVVPISPVTTTVPDQTIPPQNPIQ